MADLDDLREGADFGLGINCENQSFHVREPRTYLGV